MIVRYHRHVPYLGIKVPALESLVEVMYSWRNLWNDIAEKFLLISSSFDNFFRFFLCSVKLDPTLEDLKLITHKILLLYLLSVASLPFRVDSGASNSCQIRLLTPFPRALSYRNAHKYRKKFTHKITYFSPLNIFVGSRGTPCTVQRFSFSLWVFRVLFYILN